MEPLTLFTILAMGAVTYLTRMGGDLLMRGRTTLSPRMTAALNAVPAAVLTAVIAPSVLTAGLAEAIAGAITLVAAFRLPLLATVAVGLGTVVAMRSIL
jgi:uncharacterized membrane protein